MACDKALRQLGVFDRQRWWEHLPDDELTAAQSEKLQDEVHATLLLYATEVAKYTLPSAGLLDFARFLISEGNPELYRIAGQLCQLAEAYRPTQVGSLLELYCRFGLGDVSVTTSFSELSEYSMAKPAPDSAVDHHFMGGAHFLLHSDPTSPLSGSMRFLQTQVDLGIDFDNTAFTARQLLLAATRLSTRPYWSYLALGVALTHAGQPEDAELVYNTCITLEPNQPEGYLERARAIMQQTVDQPASAREELSQRALADLDRSLKLAPLLPAVFKTRAELFADFPDLGRRRDAIEEYHRWLERIPPLSMYRDRTSQRGLLRGCEQIEGFCQTLIKEANEEAAARELLAAAQWASGQFDAARSTIDKLSGDGIARRPRALAIRASLTLVEAVRKQPPGAALLQQALRDVEAVNSQMPAKYQAAVLRVEIMTALGRNEEALQLLNAMVEQNVAVTSWQQYDLAAHRLRALHSLGRTADAEQALQAAHEINPIAAAGLAEWFNGNR